MAHPQLPVWQSRDRVTSSRRFRAVAVASAVVAVTTGIFFLRSRLVEHPSLFVLTSP